MDASVQARAPLDWRVGGVLLGVLGTVAVALQGPIGVSTAYVTTEAVVANAISPELVQANAYWTSIGARLSPEWVAVIGMLLGGLLSAFLFRGPRPAGDGLPRTFVARFGARQLLRFGVTFAGGFLILFGARLAGGCTSGHIISGMSQLAVSGMVFAAGVFAAGIPAALLVYRRN